MSKGFLYNFFRRPPVFFPLIALFHLWLTISEGFNYIGNNDVYLAYWLIPVVYLFYTVFWCGATMYKKWGALGYLFLTIANVSVHFFAPASIYKQALGDIMFIPVPVNLLFSFLLLFFFRRME